MSFFSKILPEQQENYATKGMVVRTMQDDIDEINGVVRKQAEPSSNKSIFSFFSSHEDTPVINNSNTIPAATNQNPFITEEKITQSSQTQEKVSETVSQPQIITPEPVQVMRPVQTDLSNQNPFNNVSTQNKEVLLDPRNPFAIAINQETPRNDSSANLNNKHTIRNSILFLVCILAIAGGIYYFYTITRNVPETLSTNTAAVSNNQTIPLFSTETPNYLPLDITNTTPTSLKTLLSQTSKQVAGVKSEKPVEFFITDTNNNPLSFPSFAKIAGIALSQTTLNALNDKFSLFIYTNNQSPSIGLSIELKDALTLQKSLRQDEATLAQSMSPLFLNEKSLTVTGTFRDGTYRNIPLRFMNIDPASGLSIDYAIKGNHLVIGTSMNTHHALLDLIQ